MQGNTELPTSDIVSEMNVNLERDYDERLLAWHHNAKENNEYTAESNKIVTFHDSVYIHRLHSLPTQMELTFNPIVRTHIERYANRSRKEVSNILSEGEFYFPLFEEVLDREGLPLELKYLPVIESALNPKARSRAGATGLWQFMLKTGKNYKLEINSLVDERCDPMKSTAAAAKYLKDLYNIYEDWNLVIAAYNCGPGNVNKAIRRSGGKTDFWAIYNYLPKETRSYVPSFIAATYIMNYHQEHNISPAEYKYHVSMDSLKVNKRVHFKQIASAVGISLDELRQYNPQYRNDIIPGGVKEYVLNLPTRNVLAFIDNEHIIYGKKKEELISDKELPNIPEPDKNPLLAQQEIINEQIIDDVVFIEPKIEQPKVIRKITVSSNVHQAQKVVTYHQVANGETIYRIAKNYDVSIEELKDWNNLSSNNIKVGSQLKIEKIEYVAVTEIELQEAQLLALSVDPAIAKSMIRNYIEENGNLIYSSHIIDETDKNNMKLLASANEYDYKTTVYSTKKKDIFTQIAGTATSAYGAVKNWGGSLTEKLKSGKDSNKLLAENKPNPTDNSSEVTESVNSNNNVEIAIVEEDLKTKNASLESNMQDFYKIYHKVRIGETMTQIAARYKVSKEDIIEWNNLNSSIAKISQRLMIFIPKNKSLASHKITKAVSL